MSAATPRNAERASCLVNGKAVKSCTVLALQLEGADVLSIEGLAPPDGPLHPMQEAFRENHGLQCGYCTPGMILTAVDMVRRKGNELDDHTIREELEGNICRCTGYHNIVKAIAAGARAMKAAEPRRPPNRRRHGGISKKNAEETAMSATGIGAAVRRKEDHRFITGKGHYTDDINRPGQALRLSSSARRTRTPRSNRSIPRPPPRMPGVARDPHRRRLGRRQDRQSHLRLDDPFQRRLADEDGAASGARQRQSLSCRRSGRGGHRRDAGAGARRRRKGEGRLRRIACGCRSGSGTEAGRAADPRCRAQQHDLSVAARRPKAVRCRFQSRPSTSPSSTSSTIAWCRTRWSRAPRSREYDAGSGHLDAVEHVAKSACRAACHRRLRRHGARTQAARDRARRRRRFRLEDFHLSRRGRGAYGPRSASAGR